MNALVIDVLMIDDSVCGSYADPAEDTEMEQSAKNVRMEQDLNLKIVCCCQLQSKSRQRLAIPHSVDQKTRQMKIEKHLKGRIIEE